MKQIYTLKECKGKIQSPADLFKKINNIDVDYNQENFLIFYLDTKNKVLGSDILFKGGLNACLVDPKTIFRNALINNSCNIIIAHNHPSKDLEPSNEDKVIFSKLKKAGEIIGIGVLDSIIFNKKEFYSLDGEC